jgi:hypothetical protein
VVSGAGVSRVERLTQVPLMQPPAADAERVVAILSWSGEIAVEGD